MELLEAGVQYDDMVGEVAADEGDREKLVDFARKKGVPETHFPIAIDYYHGENYEHLSVVAVAKNVASSFDECQRYAGEHDGKLPAVRFTVAASFDELLQYFKRFSLVFRRRLKIDQIEVEDVDLTQGAGE